MKKMLFFIIVFSIIFDVSAITCSYTKGGANVTLDVFVKTNRITWLDAYSFGNPDGGELYNEEESSTDSSGLVVLPYKTAIFNNFKSFGFVGDDGTCPVLVKIDDGRYTVIPYDTYTSFFAPSATYDCVECGDTGDYTNAANYHTKNKRYNFAEICDYFDKFRGGQDNYSSSTLSGSSFLETNPYLGYLYYINSNVKEACILYNTDKTSPGLKLKDMLEEYKNNFIVGEPADERLSTCPEVEDYNDTQEIMDCFLEKHNNLTKAINDFRDTCSEREMRAIQLYAGGSIAKFYDKHSVSAYLNNEIKLLGGSFSSECASAADDLYLTVINAGRVYNAYNKHSALQQKMLPLSLYSNYVKGMSLLVTINSTLKPEKDACNLISDDMKEIISEILNALRIGACVLVILLTIVEVYKAIIAGDGNTKQKLGSLITKRLIALAVILLLPTIIMIILDIVNRYIKLPNSSCVVGEITNS